MISKNFERIVSNVYICMLETNILSLYDDFS